jgi:hypothetical protein
MRTGDFNRGQRVVETIAMTQKSPLGQPKSYFCEHLFGQLDNRKTILSVHSHVYRQADRFAGPGRIDSQGQNHQIQSPAINYRFAVRTHRISPPSGSINFFTATVKKRIVKICVDSSGPIEYSDQQNRQKSPQAAHRPASIREKSVIRIVCSLAARFSEWHNSGNGMFGGAENPSAEEVCKYLCRWSGEYWKKVLYYVIPCRNNVCSIHTNLPVVSVSIQSSEGWYVFVYSPSKLEIQKVRKLS